MSKEKSPLVTVLHYIDRAVYHIEEKVIAFSVILLAIILIANVILRTSLFNSSLASTEELSQFLMFFITFLGTSYAARSGMHIRMSMLQDALKGTPRKIMAIIVSLGTAIVMFYVAYLSYRYVMKIASLNRVTPILQWPVQYVWIIMPIGIFLTGVQYTMAFFRNLISPGAWVSYSIPLEKEPTAMSDFNEQIINSEDPDPPETPAKHHAKVNDENKEDKTC